MVNTLHGNDMEVKFCVCLLQYAFLKGISLHVLGYVYMLHDCDVIIGA